MDDIVNALGLALEKGWGYGHIQIRCSYCTSIKESAEKVVKIYCKDTDIFYDASKPKGDKAHCEDYSKVKEILGLESTVALEEGINQPYE